MLLTIFLASLIFNLVVFVPAYLLGTDKLTDISYSLTFLFISIFAFFKGGQTTGQLILMLAVMVWAFRLGTFLLTRVLATGKDKRFDDMRSHFWKFSRFWILQGASVFVILISSALFWNLETTRINLLSGIGLLVFLGGLLLESVADQQKRNFSKQSSNKGKWIETGVWSRSRHPNYLGEMLVWSGLYLFVLPSFNSNERLVGLISPFYIMILLLFVSGIPLLEKSANKKWGSDKDYQNYKKSVPVLIPRKLW